MAVGRRPGVRVLRAFCGFFMADQVCNRLVTVVPCIRRIQPPACPPHANDQTKAPDSPGGGDYSDGGRERDNPGTMCGFIKHQCQ